MKRRQKRQQQRDNAYELGRERSWHELFTDVERDYDTLNREWMERMVANADALDILSTVDPVEDD